MAQFASDAFTGTAGTELTAYNAAWTEHTSYATGNLVLSDANRIRRDSAANPALYWHSGTPASADYSVSADLFTKEANAGVMYNGVVGRVDTAANTCYLAQYAGDTPDAWRLLKIVAGTATVLGSSAAALTDETSYNVKLEMIGSAVKMYKEGSATALFSVTDTAITAAGRAGVRLAGTAAETNTTGAHLDNFSADDISSVTLVSTTQAGAWSVSNIVSTTQAGAFSVRNLANTTQAGGWSVRNAVDTTQAGAWSVFNTVSQTQAGAWSVINLAATTQAGAFSVRNLAATTQAGAWSVRNLAATTQAGAWSVAATGIASSTQAGSWSVRNLAATTQDSAWTIRNLVDGTQGGAWTVRNGVSTSQAGAWSVFGSASTTQNGAWSARNLSSTTQAGAWSVDGSTVSLSAQRSIYSNTQSATRSNTQSATRSNTQSARRPRA